MAAVGGRPRVRRQGLWARPYGRRARHARVERGYRHFLYGSSEATLARLQANLHARFPGLDIVGAHSPPFRALTAEEDAAIIEMINAARPDIVWVGLSTPKQERWMAEHRNRLEAPVLVGVGAALDFHAGVAAASSPLHATRRVGVAVPASDGAAATLATLPAQQPRLPAAHFGPEAGSQAIFARAEMTMGDARHRARAGAPMRGPPGAASSSWATIKALQGNGDRGARPKNGGCPANGERRGCNSG